MPGPDGFPVMESDKTSGSDRDPNSIRKCIGARGGIVDSAIIMPIEGGDQLQITEEMNLLWRLVPACGTPRRPVG